VQTSDGLRVTLWVAVAVGLLGEAYLPLGRAGFCVRSALGLLWPALAAGGLMVVVVRGVRALTPRSRASWLVLIVVFCWVGAVTILNLTPPIARDELTHHLAMPALYVAAGRVIEVPFADQSYYPMALEMLYTPLVARGWEIVPKLLHAAFGLAACALVAEYLAARGNAVVALLTAALLFTTPTVSILAASAYVDLGLLFFSAAAVIGLLRWSETERREYFVAAALAAGCSAAVKYNGLVLVIVLGLGVLWLMRNRSTVAALGSAVAFVALSLVPLIPWLVKNAAQTGNPIFPLFNGLIGGRPLPQMPSIDLFTKRQVLYGETLFEIVLAPIRVFITGHEGDPARFDGVFNPIYLLGFATALRPGATDRQRWFAGIAALLLAMVFLLNTFRSRYGVAVLVPLALVLAEVLEHGLGRWRRVALAGIAAALAFNGWHLVSFWMHIDPLSYLTGRESRSAFIARFVPEYPLVEFANTKLPKDTRVDLEFLGSRGYYWQRPYRYDAYFSGTTLRDTIRGAASGDEVAAGLRRAGITHIAAADGLLFRFLGDNLSEIEYKRWEDFGRDHLRRLYGERGFGLYEIG